MKKSSSALASALTFRTSPLTTTPGSSDVRASCMRRGLPPLFTTLAAAICEAPILRPTSSLFFAFFFARGATATVPPVFDPLFLRGFGTS